MRLRSGRGYAVGEVPAVVDAHDPARSVQVGHAAMPILARDGANQADLEAVAQQVKKLGWDARVGGAGGALR